MGYLTGKPTYGVFAFEETVELIKDKVNINEIDPDEFEQMVSKGVIYLNRQDHGNGVSIVDNKIENKLVEYHSRRLEMLKVEDLLNLFTTELEIQTFNDNVRVLSDDEVAILNNNNYRILRVFDGTDKKNTLECHYGSQIRDPHVLLENVISLKKQYNQFGQI